MMVQESLESVLNELVPDHGIDQFSIDWVLNSPRATGESVRAVYEFLREKGLSNKKIASRAELLGMNPDAIERNYQALKELGLSNKKIASRAPLLGRDPDAIKRNYQHHVGLLRQDYRNGRSGRDLLLTYAQLLGISSDTLESDVQFLYGMGVDYNNGILLGTKPQTKRKKMAWMLRELFDYRNIPQDKKPEAIRSLYAFIKEYPAILTKSIISMDRTKERLRERVAEYIN